MFSLQFSSPRHLHTQTTPLHNVKIHIYGKILSLTMSLWSEATDDTRRLGTFFIKPSTVITSSRRLNLNDSIDYAVFPKL